MHRIAPLEHVMLFYHDWAGLENRDTSSKVPDAGMVWYRELFDASKGPFNISCNGILPAARANKRLAANGARSLQEVPKPTSNCI
ncbi:MAG: hypothetical protein C7B45_01690 [Sulfobacillus acidophilus]|uniref:Uncharacterized protein n=1 Tax=Sulfobacillus acidophilus TaxID=53633 RepID=A0A2T2WNE5_9FIRM|nr:MAG: hypothetical protein C7B45_01690 [Sulfobacillus acidophilus]